MKDSHSDSDLSSDNETAQEQFGSQPTRGLSGLAPGTGTSGPSSAAPPASTAASGPRTENTNPTSSTEQELARAKFCLRAEMKEWC